MIERRGPTCWGMAIGSSFASPKEGPAVECGGALVCCQVIKWQPEVRIDLRQCAG